MTITTIPRWGHHWPTITADGALSYAEADPGYRLRQVEVDDLAGRARGGRAAPHLFGGAEVVARAARSITVRLPPGGGLVDWTDRVVVYHLPERRLVWTGPVRDVGQVPGLPRLLGDREDGLLEARLREAEVFYRDVLAGRELLFAEVAEAARDADGKGVAIGSAGLVLPLRAVDELAQSERWNERAPGRGRIDLELVDAWQVEEPAERPGYTALVPLLCGLAAPLTAEALRAGDHHSRAAPLAVVAPAGRARGPRSRPRDDPREPAGRAAPGHDLRAGGCGCRAARLGRRPRRFRGRVMLTSNQWTMVRRMGRARARRDLHELFLRSRSFAHHSEVSGSRYFAVGEGIAGLDDEGRPFVFERVDGGWVIGSRPPSKRLRVRVKNPPASGRAGGAA